MNDIKKLNDTNIGAVPEYDLMHILAIQWGFESYEDMIEKGYHFVYETAF